MSEQNKDKAVSQEVLETAEQKASSQDDKAATAPEKPKQFNKKPKQAKGPDKPKKPGFWLFWVLILVVVLFIGAAAGGYWLVQNVNQKVDLMAAKQQALSEQLQASQSQLQSVQSSLATSRNEWQQAYSELEQMVISSAQRWNRNADLTENRWSLEEALTLTRLAEQRLQLDSSATVASGLLTAADTILSNMDQAAVLPLRRQLAADKLALESTDSADIHGLYFTLEAMADQIRELHWLPKPISQSEIESNVSPGEGFWQGLKRVFVVTRLDVPMQAPPLLTDFEQWRQRTLLLLEQAQLALLSRNQSLFDAAVSQSSTLIAAMESQMNVAPYLEQLSTLQEAVLNPQWPDIRASVELIEQYLAGQSAAEEAEE
jgi:uroporphyrin-3 C-methyltransferase